MTEPHSCVSRLLYRRDGRIYERICHERDETCGDCGVARGMYHHLGCTKERSPIGKAQLLGCEHSEDFFPVMEELEKKGERNYALQVKDDIWYGHLWGFFSTIFSKGNQWDTAVRIYAQLDEAVKQEFHRLITTLYGKEREDFIARQEVLYQRIKTLNAETAAARWAVLRKWNDLEALKERLAESEGKQWAMAELLKRLIAERRQFKRRPQFYCFEPLKK